VAPTPPFKGNGSGIAAGDKSGSKGWQKQPDQGGTSTAPSGYSSGYKHHSAPEVAASLAPQATARIAAIFHANPYDFIAIEDALDEELGLDQQERNLVSRE
jgi:hypothetical protein